MEYKCTQCKEEWGFFPEDYEDISDYPSQCPLCSMPLFQMIMDVYSNEGVIGVIKQLYKRI